MRLDSTLASWRNSNDRRKQDNILRRLGALPVQREGHNPGLRALQDCVDGGGCASRLARAECGGGMKPPLRQGSSDDFQTPPIALKPLLPYLKSDWRIWECACGNGNLVR